MKIIQGTGICAGVVRGKVVFNKAENEAIVRRDGSGCQEEWQRVQKAQSLATSRLESLVRKYEETDPEAARLFEAYEMILADQGFLETIRGILYEDHCDAEYGVYLAGTEYAARLAALDDPYIRSRSADILDVTMRLIKGLQAENEEKNVFDEAVILIADDISVTELAHLDREHVQAVALRGGSAYSHAAIMLNSMNISSLCQLETNPDELLSGQKAYVDGDAGQLILDADPQTKRLLNARIRAQKNLDKKYRLYKGKADKTRDGRELPLLCNINRPEEAADVMANDGGGIGLFRTEFLLDEQGGWPSEDIQYEAYKEAVMLMEDRPVIIRTMDAGADKKVADIGMSHERNPAMGLRSIRLSLSEPELFKQQLRAIYRASAWGCVSIMFPMITSVEEIKRAKAICLTVRQELKEENVPFREDVGIGIMIETPSAVLLADEMASEADFFSIGTNDLTQFILACDRERTDMGDYYDPHHPAVLKAIRLVSEAAHRRGIPVGICGEISSDTSLMPYFLEIGIDTLSVPPCCVLPLREKLRGMTT